MKNQNCLYLALVFSILLTSRVSVFSADGASSPPTKHMLTGGVAHSEELAPLPLSLEPGKTFSGLQDLQPLVDSTGIINQQPTSPAQKYSVSKYPMKKGAINSTVNYQKQQAALGNKVSKQFKDYLQHQAKQGNTGTVGLTNFLQTGRSHAPSTLPKPAPGTGSIFLKQGPKLSGCVKQQVAPRRFIIPSWLAGAWARTESNELSRIQLPNHHALKPAGKTTAKVKDTFGNYRDTKGQIWQVFDPKNASGSVDRGDAIDYHNVSYYDLATTSDTMAIVKVRATHVVVSKKTHLIVSAYQDEELNTYTKLAAKRLRTDSSVKVFDQKGKATLLTKATSVENKLSI